MADSNVLLDVATADPVWADWSQRQIDEARWCEALDLELPERALEVLEIPREALFLAARVSYRRRGGRRTGVLPDFLIGAPSLTVIAPEALPG